MKHFLVLFFLAGTYVSAQEPVKTTAPKLPAPAAPREVAPPEAPPAKPAGEILPPPPPPKMEIDPFGPQPKEEPPPVPPREETIPEPAPPKEELTPEPKPAPPSVVNATASAVAGPTTVRVSFEEIASPLRALDGRLGRIETGLDERLGRIETRLDDIDRKVDVIGSTVGRVDQRTKNMGVGLRRIDRKVDTINTGVAWLIHAEKLERIRWLPVDIQSPMGRSTVRVGQRNLELYFQCSWRTAHLVDGKIGVYWGDVFVPLAPEVKTYDELQKLVAAQ